jgi:hypothetical protein
MAPGDSHVHNVASSVRDRGSELLQRGLGRFGLGGGAGPDRARATITIDSSAVDLLELLRSPATWQRLIALADPPEVVVDGESDVRWTARPDSPVRHEGTVTLRPAPQGRGTEATFEVHIADPASIDASALTPLATHPLELLPRFLARKAGRRLKSLAETGEVPTLEHNPHAPRASRG